MSDAVQNVIDDTERLQQLRHRMTELDAERARVDREINECMARIAATAGTHVPPPANSPLAHQILWVLRRHRDRPLAPADVAELMGFRRELEVANLRVHLSRMYRKGWIRRVGHGRYQAFNE